MIPAEAFIALCVGILGGVVLVCCVFSWRRHRDARRLGRPMRARAPWYTP